MSTMVINRSDEALESIGTFLRKIDIQMSLMIAFHRVAYDWKSLRSNVNKTILQLNFFSQEHNERYFVLVEMIHLFVFAKVSIIANGGL